MNRTIRKIGSAIYYLSAYWYYRLIFGSLGWKTRIRRGLRVEHPANITIGRGVQIGNGAWLAATPHVSPNPRLVISDFCSIGRSNQIYSNTSIEIGRYVLTGDKVFISDGVHDFTDIHTPIMHQAILSKGPMTIGEGTWIGINACIIGASVGKNCVIGANSVVTRDIPDFCMAGGNPARIIKRFNPDTQRWERTSGEGNFLKPDSL